MKPQDLREWRQGLAMTQEQAAREMGVSLSSVRRWERGEKQPKWVDLVCEALTARRLKVPAVANR